MLLAADPLNERTNACARRRPPPTAVSVNQSRIWSGNSLLGQRDEGCSEVTVGRGCDLMRNTPSIPAVPATTNRDKEGMRFGVVTISVGGRHSADVPSRHPHPNTAVDLAGVVRVDLGPERPTEH